MTEVTPATPAMRVTGLDKPGEIIRVENPKPLVKKFLDYLGDRDTQRKLFPDTIYSFFRDSLPRGFEPDSAGISEIFDYLVQNSARQIEQSRESLEQGQKRLDAHIRMTQQEQQAYCQTEDTKNRQELETQLKAAQRPASDWHLENLALHNQFKGHQLAGELADSFGAALEYSVSLSDPKRNIPKLEARLANLAPTDPTEWHNNEKKRQRHNLKYSRKTLKEWETAHEQMVRLREDVLAFFKALVAQEMARQAADASNPPV